jgi:hypothetical protein
MKYLGKHNYFIFLFNSSWLGRKLIKLESTIA